MLKNGTKEDALDLLERVQKLTSKAPLLTGSSTLQVDEGDGASQLHSIVSVLHYAGFKNLSLAVGDQTFKLHPTYGEDAPVALLLRLHDKDLEVWTGPARSPPAEPGQGSKAAKLLSLDPSQPDAALVEALKRECPSPAACAVFAVTPGAMMDARGLKRILNLAHRASQRDAAPVIQLAWESGAPQITWSEDKKYGYLPPSLIQAVVRRSFGELRSCYEMGLARDRNLKGRLYLRFTIEADGAIGELSVNLVDLPAPEVASCIEAASRPLRFPPPLEKRVTVVYPLNFAPSE